MFTSALMMLIGGALLMLRLSPNGSFPSPLSKDEEKLYVDRWLAGDIEARNALVEHNLRLVAHIIKKYYTQTSDVDDLISIGTIGLIKAVNTFRVEKNIKLATYASRCIENEILMFLRKTSRVKLEVSLDEPLNVDWDGNELLLGDVLGTDDDVVSRRIEDEAELELLRAAVSRLSERDRQIIELRFGLNGRREYTQKQVADMLGISQSYISRLEKRILSELYDDMMSCLG